MRSNNSQLGLKNNNRYTILSRVMDNTFCYDLNNRKLLNSGATGLVMSSEFARKQ